MSNDSSTMTQGAITFGAILFAYLFFYAMTQIMNFYNIDTSKFSDYFVFYLFLFISAFVLPTQIPEL